MNNLTVNLHTAKHLKEHGFPQDTNSYWVGIELRTNTWQLCERPHDMLKWRKLNYLAAPLAEEVLKELPHHVEGYFLKIIKNIDGEYAVLYDNTDDLLCAFSWSKNLADLIGKMYIYLKKEGLL